jgi:hypothetical protein
MGRKSSGGAESIGSITVDRAHISAVPVVLVDFAQGMALHRLPKTEVLVTAYAYHMQRHVRILCLS